MDATIRIQWPNSEGKTQEGFGRVRNVSAKGLFIETPAPPPLETKVSLQFDLDAKGNVGASVQTKGYVNRVDPVGIAGRAPGFAVYVGGRMRLLRNMRTVTNHPS